MAQNTDDNNNSRPSNDEAAVAFDHPTRSTEAFFGRRKGKPFKPHQAELYANLLPKLAIDIEQPECEDLKSLFSNSPEQIVLEIGFGGAEHLIHRAKLHPEIGFIGCEPFMNGMAKALSSIERENLSNIRLFNEDATQLLDWLPEKQIDRVDLLYPDPWPKKRHWKRRFVNQKNLARIHRVIRVAGEFRFASDIDTYINWTLNHCDAFSNDTQGLVWKATKASDWHEAWEEWYSTRYEQKAIREGRTPAYLKFDRI
ncbi:MAG: tRNA (guanosine(46)-N7)-methyltransferase TrmB [Nitratireductor sp.]